MRNGFSIGKATRFLGAALLLASALVFSGCDDGTAATPAKIVYDGPPVLCGALDKPLPRRLAFTVYGSDTEGGEAKRLVANALIRFDIFEHPEDAPGRLSVAETRSDAGGQAFLEFTPGAKPGVYRIRARLVDAPGAADALVPVLGGMIVSGGGQDGWAGSSLAEPFAARFETAPGVFAHSGRVRFAAPAAGDVKATLDHNEPVINDEGVARAQLTISKGFGPGTATMTVLESPLGPEAARYPLPFNFFALNPWPLLTTVLGGLALFVFGMNLMSDGLQFLAGDRMRSLLNKLTSNRMAGVAVGATVTAIIQSSSACTVMVVGFVNAGLMSLTQAIGVIIGSNVGTTITAQLIALNLSDLALPAVTLGLLAQILVKSRRGRYGGQIFIGFGLLFLGLTLMGDTLQTLKDSALVRDLFAAVACEPGPDGTWSVMSMLLAVGVGIVVTMVVQSSSVTTGILIMLAASGLLQIYTAYAILLGENIGTTVTAIMASAGGTTTAKRAAAFHVLFNTVGVVVMVALQFVPWPGTGRPIFMELVHHCTGGNNFRGENLPRFLANAHTLFNLFTALYFLPFVGLAAKVCIRIVPEDPAELAKPKRRALEPNLLKTPSLALQQTWGEMATMLALGRKAHGDALAALLKPDAPDWDQLADEVRAQESDADDFQADVTNYLGQLSMSRLNERQAQTLPLILSCVDDVEKLGDYSRHLLKLARRVRKRSLPFTDEARGEMDRMVEALERLFALAGEALATKSSAALDSTPVTIRQRLREQVREAAKRLKAMASEFRKNHEARHEAAACDIRSGVVFLDLMQTSSRIATHLANLTRAACDAED